MPRSRRRAPRPAARARATTFRPAPPRRAGDLDAAAPPSPRRSAFERRSRPALLLLSRQPRWVLAGALLAITIGGLSVRGLAGAAALLLVAGFFGWLLALSWPVIPGRGRLLRLLTIGALAAAAGYFLAA